MYLVIRAAMTPYLQGYRKKNLVGNWNRVCRTNYPYSKFTTWAMSIEQIRQETTPLTLTGKLCSLCNPMPFPEEMFVGIR